MPPNDETLKPISVDESTANVLAPELSTKFKSFIMSSSWAVSNIASENTRYSTDFANIARDAS